MSHVVKQKIEFKDLASLKRACEDLGWKFMEGQTSYRWYGRHVGDYPLPEGVKKEQLGTCVHAIQVPGSTYEIGLMKDANGDLFPIWDFYKPGGLYEVMGETGAVLKGAYGAAAAKQFLGRKGFRLVTDKMVDGQRRMKFARASQT